MYLVELGNVESEKVETFKRISRELYLAVGKFNYLIKIPTYPLVELHLHPVKGRTV